MDRIRRTTTGGCRGSSVAAGSPSARSAALGRLDQPAETYLGLLGCCFGGWVGGRRGGLAVVPEVDLAVAAARAPAFRRGWVVEQVANRETGSCQHCGVVATGKAFH